jgi:diaphanous 1
MNDTAEKLRVAKPVEKTTERVSSMIHLGPDSTSPKTTNESGNASPHPQAAPDNNSQDHAAGRTMRRGDYDQAIRSMRDGQRRRRPNHATLSKIFLDGGRPQSRVFD